MVLFREIQWARPEQSERYLARMLSYQSNKMLIIKLLINWQCPHRDRLVTVLSLVVSCSLQPCICISGIGRVLISTGWQVVVDVDASYWKAGFLGHSVASMRRDLFLESLQVIICPLSIDLPGKVNDPRTPWIPTDPISKNRLNSVIFSLIV